MLFAHPVHFALALRRHYAHEMDEHSSRPSGTLRDEWADCLWQPGQLFE